MNNWQRQLLDELGRAEAADRVNQHAVADRVADILRPAGALQRLDEVAIWLAGWQRTARPSVDRPLAIIFAGDHGVASLSAYPQEVTGAMVKAFEKSQASISSMAKVAGASVQVVDTGVGQPTGDIRVGPAMDEARFQNSFDLGRRAVADSAAELESAAEPGSAPDLLVVGEMGIGNTTSAAAIICSLLDCPASVIVGRGTGVDDDGLKRKAEGVTSAVQRFQANNADSSISLRDQSRQQSHSPGYALAALQELGGTEIAAMAGALAEARIRSIPVLLDGFVVASAALVLSHLHPDATGNLWAGHRSAETGHRAVLDHLELRPLLDLELRLGEASGAMAAVPLVKMACALVTDVPTFTEWFG